MKMKLQEHILVPEHKIVPEKEIENILKTLGIKKHQLPKIRKSDPIIQEIGAKPGDVIKITRDSLTARKAVVYRVVVE